MTGALICQETESGFVRGAAVGAISGAVFLIEVFESSLVLWQLDESGIGCLLYLMGAVKMSFDEVHNIFDTGSSKKGLTGDSVEKIPKIVITNDNNVDDSGERECRVRSAFSYGAILDNLQGRYDLFDRIKGCIVDSGGDPEINPKVFENTEVKKKVALSYPFDKWLAENMRSMELVNFLSTTTMENKAILRSQQLSREQQNQWKSFLMSHGKSFLADGYNLIVWDGN